MLLEARHLDAGTVLDCDVCIVGAGACGIAIARELSRAGLEVVLLEGGRRDYDPRSQRLYEGVEEGTLLDGSDHYLSSTRLRYFGGTTNHWNGWCRPFDPIDFETRDWVDGSGWPFSRQVLDPYYDRAAAIVEIESLSAADARGMSDEERGFLSPASGFEATRIEVSSVTRFGAAFAAELENTEHLRVVLDANVTAIDAAADAQAVVSVSAVGLFGGNFTVRGRAYVLAASTIENARLLLASDGVQPEGLGNRHDLVGRYFMEHPRVRVGLLSAPDGRRDLLPYWKTRRVGEWRERAVLSTKADMQRRQRLLNSIVVLHRLGGGEVSELAVAVAGLAGEVRRLAGVAPEERAATLHASLMVTAEQSPNPASRVTLDDERDELGMRRARLEWRLTERDAESIRLTSEHLAASIAREHRGRVVVSLTPADPWRGAGWSPHQMGTTRMDPAPERGVVDPSGRVHGVDNLWVAGGSVFPTAGCSNPTWTMLALSLRLADELRAKVAS